jgi:flagellar basal body rod protein FlgG
VGDQNWNGVGSRDGGVEMNEEEQLLEENGWTVECESPLEIRHKDGSFATGQAASIVLSYLQSEGEDSAVET